MTGELEAFVLDRITEDRSNAESVESPDGGWYSFAKSTAGATPMLRHLLRADPVEVAYESTILERLIVTSREFPDAVRAEVLKALAAGYRFHEDFRPAWSV